MTVISEANFIQANSHDAHTLRREMVATHGYRGGVIPGTATFTDLKVTQRGAGANMSVDVAEGSCYVTGTESNYQGIYHGDNQGTTNVVITAANPTNPRRTLIVARIKDSEYGVAVTDEFVIEAIDGTPAGSPADPTVPDNCIVLARVAVAAAASSITDANITDLRIGYTAVTGSSLIGNQVCAASLGGVVVCTSTFRPTKGLYEGLIAYETDTDRRIVYTGSGWAWLPGLISYVESGGSDQTGISTVTDITGVTTTFTPPSVQRIKITGQVVGLSVSAGGLRRYHINKDGTDLTIAFRNYASASQFETITWVAYDTPTVASHTYKLRATSDAGTVTISNSIVKSTIVVEAV